MLFPCSACSSDLFFIPSDDLPDEADWWAVVALDSAGLLLRASGLSSARDPTLRVDVEPLAASDRVLVLGFRSSELQGLVDLDSLDTLSRPLRFATEFEPILPEASWQFARAVGEDGLTPDATQLSLTSEASRPCPDVGSAGAPGVFQISCAEQPCIPNVVQRECSLELDFRAECGAGRVFGRSDARGGFTAQAPAEWFGICESKTPAPDASFSLECREGNERTCQILAYPAASRPGIRWDAVRLIPDAPRTAGPEDPELLAGAIIPVGEESLVLFGPPRYTCPPGFEQRLYFVSRADLTFTRTATLSECLNHLGVDPVTGALLGMSAAPFAWVRMDEEGRVTERRPFSLEHPGSRPVPLSVVYHPRSHRMVASFGEPMREDREVVEYVSFDADTLVADARSVVERPRSEYLVVAWDEFIILDDDNEALRFVSLPDFQTDRIITLSRIDERRQYARVGFFPAIDRLGLRIGGRGRSMVLVGPDGRQERVYNFETNGLPYSYALAPWARPAALLVGIHEIDGANSTGALAMLHPETLQYAPGLVPVDGDTPDDMYSGEGDPHTYVLLRRTARLLEVGPASP